MLGPVYVECGEKVTPFVTGAFARTILNFARLLINMRYTMLLISILSLFGCFKGARAPGPDTLAPASSFHSLSAIDIHGEPFSFEQLKGHKVIVVNTASECGYTPQYKQLQELYAMYQSKGLVIIGFPCNQFGGQEPGSAQQIESFCQRNYGVTFPMMEKVEVKGKAQHPVYRWLTSKTENGALDSEVKWNFHKFLINEEGRMVMSLESGVSPTDDRVLSWLDGQ